jgi:hypothetical protein
MHIKKETIICQRLEEMRILSNLYCCNEKKNHGCVISNNEVIRTSKLTLSKSVIGVHE